MRSISRAVGTTRPRVLVLGGTGRVGGLLRKAWARSPEGAELGLVWQARRADAVANLVFDPLGESEALRDAVAAADVVLNLAGCSTGDGETMAQHAALAVAVLRAAEGRAPVLSASSAAVYGSRAAAVGVLSEDAPTEPEGAYGRAKLAMEDRLRGMPGATVLRIGNVVGADALLGGLVPPGGRVLHFTPEGRALQRSYIGPRALARALARLLQHAAIGRALPHCLNLAQPGTVGMDAMLRAAGECWVPAPAPPGTIATVALDVSRAVGLGLVADKSASAVELVADLNGVTGGAA